MVVKTLEIYRAAEIVEKINAIDGLEPSPKLLTTAELAARKALEKIGPGARETRRKRRQRSGSKPIIKAKRELSFFE